MDVSRAAFSTPAAPVTGGAAPGVESVDVAPVVSAATPAPVRDQATARAVTTDGAPPPFDSEAIALPGDTQRAEVAHVAYDKEYAADRHHMRRDSQLIKYGKQKMKLGGKIAGAHNSIFGKQMRGNQLAGSVSHFQSMAQAAKGDPTGRMASQAAAGLSRAEGALATVGSEINSLQVFAGGMESELAVVIKAESELG